jgi:hypothetical protein
VSRWRIKFVRWGVVARWPRRAQQHPWQEHRQCLYVDHWGVWFYHPRHAEIGWLWPWRRGGDRRGRRWVDMSCGGYFWTLRELDEFWKGYWEAVLQRDPRSDAEGM